MNDPPGVLDIADVVIDQRPVECLLWVTGGKTQSEYMFSEIPQVADITGSVGSLKTPRDSTAGFRC